MASSGVSKTTRQRRPGGHRHSDDGAVRCGICISRQLNLKQLEVDSSKTATISGVRRSKRLRRDLSSGAKQEDQDKQTHETLQDLPMDTSDLSRLPLEIRQFIYRFVFETTVLVFDVYDGHYKLRLEGDRPQIDPHQNALLRTSKRIYYEAIGFYFSASCIVLNTAEVLRSGPLYYSQLWAGHVTRLELQRGIDTVRNRAVAWDQFPKLKILTIEHSSFYVPGSGSANCHVVCADKEKKNEEIDSILSEHNARTFIPCEPLGRRWQSPEDYMDLRAKLPTGTFIMVKRGLRARILCANEDPEYEMEEWERVLRYNTNTKTTEIEAPTYVSSEEWLEGKPCSRPWECSRHEN